MKIVIEVPDAIAPRLLEAVRAQYGWTEKVQDPNDPEKEIANPLTLEDQVVEAGASFYRNLVVSQEIANAQRTATEAAQNKAAKDLEGIKRSK